MTQNADNRMIITCDGNIPSRYAHSINVMKMAQGFHRAGLDVTVVSLLSLPNILMRRRVKNIHAFYGIDDDIKIKLLPVFNRDFFRKTTGAKGFNKKAAKYVKKVAPAFAYCRSFLTLYYCIRQGVPAIIETHTANFDHPALKKVYEIAGDKAFLGMVTISESIKKEHIRRGIAGNKILVLEDGVDLDSFDIDDDRERWRRHTGMPRDKKIVLYAGSLYREKGIEHILLTAKKLRPEKAIHYVIAGGNAPQVEHWKSYCIGEKIDNVTFTGFVNPSEIPKYLKAADVLVIPYDLSVEYKVMDINTTSPIKLFEYMASKRPIVATDIPTITKIISHDESAMLAEPNDIDALARYILELTGDSRKAEQLADRAYARVAPYSWTQRCRTILDIIQ